MAIQNRRGTYDKFDPQKMLPGEWASVISGDPHASDGRAVYMCFAAGDVKRMATYEDMVENIREASGDAIDAQIDAAIGGAIQDCQTATNAADTAKKGAESAAQTAANAASAANTAKASADTAAQRANDAATETETAAADAREAAQEAREAASKVTISEEDIARIKEMILLAAYPVGKIYATVDPTNPGKLFGGTWERWGQGRVPVGVNEGDADFSEPEKTGGEKEHLLTLAETPVHSHTVNSHQHSIPALTGTAASDGSHNHRTARKNNNAASGSNMISGPYAASNIGTSGYITISTDYNGEHTHTVTTKASNTGNTSLGTNNAGGGEAHNNMQPYITCYMWKRVA